MKLLVDMNLTPRWAEFLREAVLGSSAVEAEHWSRLGPVNASDEDIMAFARAQNYIILTHDLDFGTILAVTKGAGPSVVQLRARDVNPEAIGQRVLAALRQSEAELESGALLTIEADRNRIRMLPLLRDRD
jgi:predicted nuclease of predicted toxin-antitoxin system